MADNEKDIPVKEQTDGSALVAYEMEPDPLADAEEEPKKEVKAEESEEPDEDQEDSLNEQKHLCKNHDSKLFHLCNYCQPYHFLK